MDKEKRKGEKPVPDNVSKYLNDAQLEALHHVESIGWKLMFIRRAHLQETVAVVVDDGGHIMGVLEKDGTINKQADVIIRK